MDQYTNQSSSLTKTINNTANIITANRTCRCCAATVLKPSLLVRLDDVSPVSTQSIGELFRIFTRLNVNAEDELPQHICKSCSELLFNAYAFHWKCLDTQTKLTATITTVASEKRKHLNTKLSVNASSEFVSPENQSEQNKHFDMLNRMYQCTVCHKFFRTYRGLTTHSLVHSRKSLPINYCKICSRQFQSAARHRRHVQFHRDLICYNCNQGFVSKLARTAHQSVHDNCPNKPFACCHCGRAYATRILLLRHYRCVHKTNALLYFCGECNNAKEHNFTGKLELLKHLRESHRLQHKQPKTDDDFDASVINLSESDALNCDPIGMVEEFLEDAVQLANIDSKCEIIMDLNVVPPDEVQNMHLAHEEIVDAHQDVPVTNLDAIVADDMPVIELNRLLFRYKCPKCAHTFAEQHDLMLHLAHEHDEMVLICNECGASFKKIAELELHRNDHKQENRIANESLRNFFRAARLDHNDETENGEWLAIVTDEESGNFKYKCNLCHKTYHRKFCIEQHNCPNNADSLQRYHCAECNKSFAKLPEMLAHRKTHIADTLCCSLCDKKFTTIEGLKYHLKTHTGVKAFTCSFCHKRFTANVNLNAHIRTVHSEVKPHKCDKCDASFATADHFKKHVTSSHTGIRNHTCGVCDKQFLQKTHLTQHMWKHTGIKPHPCEFCSNSFTSKTALRKHTTKLHEL